MVGINITATLQSRKEQRQQKAKHIAKAHTPPTVRVLPKNDALRRVLAHPSGNLKFRETGSREWPMDQFTKRRLREGSITIEAPEVRAAQQAASQTAPQAAPQAAPQTAQVLHRSPTPASAPTEVKKPE